MTRLRRDASVASLAVAIASLAAFAGDALLVRTLDARSVGTFFVYLAVVGLITRLMRFGLHRVALRDVPALMATQDLEGAQRRTTEILGAAMTVTGGCVAGSAALAVGAGLGFVGSELALAALWVAGESIRFVSSEVSRAWGRVAVASASGDALRHAMFAVLLLAMFVMTDRIGLPLLLGLAATSSWIAAVVAYRAVTIVSATKPSKVYPSLRQAESILRGSWRFAGADFTYSLIGQADIVIAGLVLPPRDVAIYGVASRLQRFLSLPSTVVAGAVAQRISPMYVAGELEPLSRMLRQSAFGMSVPAVAALALSLVAGDQALDTVFGSGYAEAYWPLIVLILGQLFNAASGPCALALHMLGKDAVVLRAAALSACTLIVGGLVAGTLWGILGLALVSAGATAMQNVVLTRTLTRRTELAASVIGSHRPFRPSRRSSIREVL